MTMYKVFIDGEAGTTGLQIRQRLQHHDAIEIVSIEHALRKDLNAKKQLLNNVDVTILCLPDAAAKEAALLATDTRSVRVLDASSAHRTHKDWIYGLAEMDADQRQKIQHAQKVSNPGCYATGGILILRPLTDAGLLKPEALISINAISGYTGGGRQMVEAYEGEDQHSVNTFGLYGLEFQHKHTPEIMAWAGLKRRPVFVPSVGAFDQGMLVHTMIDHRSLQQATNSAALHQLFSERYAHEANINVMPLNNIEETSAPFLTPHGISGKNSCDLYLYSSDKYEQTMIVAKLDNLGKGASGAAVQNLNIMLGLDEMTATELS